MGVILAQNMAPKACVFMCGCLQRGDNPRDCVTPPCSFVLLSMWLLCEGGTFSSTDKVFSSVFFVCLFGLFGLLFFFTLFFFTQDGVAHAKIKCFFFCTFVVQKRGFFEPHCRRYTKIFFIRTV